MVKEASKNYNIYKLYLYKLTHLPTKDKVRFYYGLKGRDGKSGLIKKHNIIQLARGALLVTQNQAEAVRSFLKEWGCETEEKEVLTADEYGQVAYTPSRGDSGSNAGDSSCGSGAGHQFRRVHLGPFLLRQTLRGYQCHSE